jgi:hypothetical protein
MRNLRDLQKKLERKLIRFDVFSQIVHKMFGE